METEGRIIPQLPPEGKRVRLLIDTDAANEIDDLYAIALAVASPDRFTIEGFIATHFAQYAGRESIQASYDRLHELLAVGGLKGKYTIVRGGAIRCPTGRSQATATVRRCACPSANNHQV